MPAEDLNWGELPLVLPLADAPDGRTTQRPAAPPSPQRNGQTESPELSPVHPPAAVPDADPAQLSEPRTTLDQDRAAAGIAIQTTLTAGTSTPPESEALAAQPRSIDATVDAERFSVAGADAASAGPDMSAATVMAEADATSAVGSPVVTTATATFALHGGFYSAFADLAQAAYVLDESEGIGISRNFVKAYADEAMARVGNYWNVLSPAELGFSVNAANDAEGTNSFANGKGWTMGASGIYTCDNAAAFAAVCGDALVISFRGTNDNDIGKEFTKDMVNWLDMSEHYDEMQAFIAQVDAYAASHSNIRTIYATGHSLGGGTALGYMTNHANTAQLKYEAATFAAPGFVGDVDALLEELGIQIDLANLDLQNIDLSTLGIQYDETDPDYLSIAAQLLTKIREGGAIFARDFYEASKSAWDSRIVGIEMSGDIVPDAKFAHGYTVSINAEGLTHTRTSAGHAAGDPYIDFDIEGLGAQEALDKLVAGALGLLDLHSMNLYSAAARSLDVALPQTSTSTAGSVHGFERSRFTENDSGLMGLSTAMVIEESYPAQPERDAAGQDVPKFVTGTGNNTLGGTPDRGTTDYLYGGIGSDTLGGPAKRVADDEPFAAASMHIGGAGDDVYLVDHIQDRVFERSAEGLDVVLSSVNHVLSADVEHLTLSADSAFAWFDADINGTGNNLANAITGNNGHNILTGLSGNDTLTAGQGNDVLDGGDDHDLLIARGGGDRLNGGSGNDTYDVMRVDHDPVWSVSIPTYTLQDSAGTADMLVLRDDGQGNLDGVDDLMFRAVGNDLWIDLDIDLLIDDDDEGRIIIQGQGAAGGAIESLRLLDEAGSLIGSSLSLTSAWTALTATGTSNWFRLQPGATGTNGLGLSVVAGSGEADGSGSTFVSGASQSISAGLSYTINGQLRDVGHTTTHTITPAQQGALEFIFTNYSARQAGEYLLEVTDPNGRMLESFEMPDSFSSMFHVGVSTVGPHTVRLTNIGDPQTPLIEPNNGSYQLNFRQASTSIDYESEGNNSRAEADVLALGRVTEGQLSRFNGDVDWYRVSPAQAGALEITLDGTYGGGVYPNLRMQVTDSSGVPLENFTYLGTDDYRVHHVGVTGTAAHYIKIWHDAADGALNTQWYRLGVSQANTGRDYESEANNSLATADTVTLGRVNEGQLSAPGDVDWYRVIPAQAGALEIVLDGIYSNGVYPNLTLQVTDAIGTVLETFDYLHTDNQVVYHVGVAGASAHYVKVLHDPADGAQNTQWYTLQISQANTGKDYESEANDSRASADVVTLGRTTEGQLSRPGDADWYKVTPAQAGALEIVLDGIYGSGLYPNLTLQVTDAIGTVLETFDYLHTDNQVAYHVGVAGASAHYVKVLHDPADGAQNTQWYTLQISQASTGKDYESEANDSRASADVVTLGRTTEGQLSRSGDVDWYQVTPAQVGALEIVLDGRYGKDIYPNLTLQVTDAIGTVLETFDYLQTDSQVTYHVGVAGTAAHYVKVLHDPADGAQNTEWYDLTVRQADVGKDYESEPNGSLASADLLVTGRTTEGQLSSAGDADWYRLNPSTPGTVHLTVDGMTDNQGVMPNLTLQVTDASGTVQQTRQYLATESQTTYSFDIDSNATRYIKVFHDAAHGALNTQWYTLAATVTNLAPVLAVPIADRSINEDQPWSAQLPAGTFSDPGDPLTLTATLGNGAPLPGWLSFDAASRSFGGTPGNAQVGNLDILVRAQDAAGASVSDMFRLTVNNVNDAPRLVTALSDVSVNEDATLNLTIPSGLFTDDDVGDSLLFSATHAHPGRLAWLSFDPGLRRFSGTPTNSDVGTYDITYTATDASGATRSDVFQLSVLNTRDAPVTAAASVTAVEDTAFSFNRSHFPFLDLDVGDSLQALQITSLPASGTLRLNGTAFTALTSISRADLDTGRLTYMPAADSTQTVSFGFAVSDGGGFSAPASMSVQITNVNDAPQLVAPLLDQLAFNGRLFQYQVPAAAFADPEQDAISYQATLAGGAPLPAWLQFDNLTRIFSGTPGADATGSWDVQVTARDVFGAARSDVFSLRVDPEHGATAAGATTGSVDVAIDSVIDSAGDTDWFRFQLNAGVTYTFTLDSQATGNVAGLADPVLRLLDANGLQLAVNDDAAAGVLNSRLLFTPVASGSFLAEASGYGSATGGYRLQVSAPQAHLITGTAGNDLLYGTSGSDTLDGGAGADTLVGGDGADVYIVDNVGDQVVETSAKLAGGIDTVRSSLASHVLAAHVEHGLVLGAAPGNLTGNGLANLLTGNAAANRLDGAGGADTLAGGDGNDQYVVDDAADVVEELAGAGTDDVFSNVSFTLGSHIEHLALTGTAGLTGTGNALANRIAGNGGANLLSGAAGNDTLDGGDGHDTLDGGSGADTMTGGLGDDVYFFDNAGDVIVEAAGGGIDEVRVYGSHTMAANVEKLRILSAGAVAATGNALDNVMVAGAGSNLFYGGAGNDTVDYSAAGSGVTVSLATGAFQATGGSGSDLLSSIEHLAGSAFNDSLTGSTGANRLDGGAGHDTLNGSSGADTMTGGLGDDVYFFDNAGDVIVEDAAGGTDEVRVYGSHTMAANVENLRILSAGAVAATGNALDNVLVAGAGSNLFYGGAGNDTVDYSAAGSGVTVSLATGAFQTTGGSGSDLLSSIEHLAGSAFNDSLTGSTGANRLDGGAGNDTLNGSSGADTMTGGLGDDVYFFDNGGDVIVEAAGGGTDEVRIHGSHVMAANVENLRIVSTATVAAFGNGLDNLMLGAAGANTLNGGGGHDTLTGGAGSDTLTGGTGNDVFVLDSLIGSDTITDFASGVDRLQLSMAGIAVGNGDAVINGATTIGGPGGFSAAAEWVVVTANIAGAITTASAAAAIGSASGAYIVGRKALFAVDNGSASGLFLFTAANADAVVSSGELTLLAQLTATPAVGAADLLFGA